MQKKTHESINNRLALVMKSGKFTLGYKTVLKSLRSSKGIVFVLHFQILSCFYFLALIFYTCLSSRTVEKWCIEFHIVKVLWCSVIEFHTGPTNKEWTKVII